MNRFSKLILMAALASFLMVSMFGCYGNFALTRKVYDWNGSVSGDKYVNNLVFWLLNFIPIYYAAGAVDMIVLNTIEFWTGSNPMAMEAGAEKIQYANIDGSEFKLRMTNDTLSIEQIFGANKGQIVEIKYDAANQSWYLQQETGAVKIAKMLGNQMNLIYPTGNTLTVDVSY